MGVTVLLQPTLCFVDDAPRVGWWDAKRKGWSEEGIANIEHDRWGTAPAQPL
jgi:hypothetical protein